MQNTTDNKGVYYGDYLQLDTILNAQHPESFKEGQTPAHDEMLFIIIHQTYEIWFKQILFELQSITTIFNKHTIDENAGDLETIVHRLKRIVTILQTLVQQVDIIETMAPMDFLDFRNLLRPASGFQSWQFKVVEALLGLRYKDRYGQNYYTSQLNLADLEKIKNAEQQPSVISLVNAWLERMPFLDASLWETTSNTDEADIQAHPFWQQYEKIYDASLVTGEKENIQLFKQVLYGIGTDEAYEQNRQLSPQAARSALFINLYRGYPMLELPFQLLHTLIEVDNQMAGWRNRHINMVKRMIGSRVGTGGSTGAGYLQGAMEKHYIFKELNQINSFLVNRTQLPKLPQTVVEKLSY